MFKSFSPHLNGKSSDAKFINMPLYQITLLRPFFMTRTLPKHWLWFFLIIILETQFFKRGNNNLKFISVLLSSFKSKVLFTMFTVSNSTSLGRIPFFCFLWVSFRCHRKTITFWDFKVEIGNLVIFKKLFWFLFWFETQLLSRVPTNLS